ncbi:MAG: hypothetical protein VX768_05800 [Planctomycetota bacterium]|nr:hypothetical protein [Planctomycetota bacterium]
MLYQKIMATFAFEFSRSLTTSRIATSLVLALFAPVMLSLIGMTINIDNTRQQIPFPLIVLGIFHLLAIFLAVLLWATPVVFSELEAKTWTYLAIRPHGKLSSTLGKYLNAVFWATSTASVSLTLSCLIISRFRWDPRQLQPPNATSSPAMQEWMEILTHSSQPVIVWYSILPALLLGALALSSIFIHIGLITHKRGMVFALIYAVIETIFAFLPAVVRNFTVGYHLRNIAMKTARFSPPPDIDEQVLLSENSILFHILVLLVITLVHLGAAIYWLHSREYITAEES